MTPQRSPADRLIVALDVPTSAQALQLVEPLKGQCRWFKVGLELYLSSGPTIVTALRERGYKVFLDLKLHDIPNTVASALRVLAPLGPSLLTVHAAGGPEMLRAAQAAKQDFPDLQLLAVTVLTSMDRQHLAATGVDSSPAQQVLRLGRMATECGISGLVCSAEETELLRSELGPDPLLVVPGIRLETPPKVADTEDDQKRVATPAQAIAQGASMLVVGRPITRSKDPAAAAAEILRQMETDRDPE